MTTNPTNGNSIELTKRLNGLTQKKSTKDLLDGIKIQEKIDKVLIVLLDGSSSMHSLMDNRRKDDIAWTIFKNDLAPNISGWTYGILIFSNGANWQILPTSDPTALTLAQPQTGGGTAMGQGLEVAWSWVRTNAKQARFIMLTDGEPTDMSKPYILENAERHNTIPIDTVGIGTGTFGYDPVFLREMSRITGGIFAEAGTVKLLADVILKLAPSNRPLLGPVKE